MWSETSITKALSIQLPIIQAGMAGGHTTAELVSAVSENGGLGTIGAGYMQPDALLDLIKKVKSKTNKPFAVNLFIPGQLNESPEILKETETILAPIAEKLGTDLPKYKKAESLFEEQFKIIIEEKVPVFSFTFGVPDQQVIQQCKENQIAVIGTATTVKEAVTLEKAGVQAVVAQGYEAGGHMGTFLNERGPEGIGLLALVSQMADILTVPIVAAGGIMNGKGILAALSLGASAVQMGTAFLTAVESGTDSLHKDAILSAAETDSRLTKAFSGKWARGIENDMMRTVDPLSDHLAPYPVTNQMTQPLRKKAKELRNKEYMSLWAGQGVRQAEEKKVSDLMAKWIDEAEKQLNRLTGTGTGS